MLGGLASLRHLRLAPDKAAEAACARRLQPRAHRGGADQLEHLHRLGDALDRDRSERFHVHEPLRQPDRLGREAGYPGGRELLHARRQVRGLSDRRVVHAQVAADRADHDVARVDADADLDLDAMAAAHLLGVAADRVLHAERGVAGAHRMVLVRQRRSEQRHDAVAHHLIDGPVVAMHRLHHARQHRVEDVPRLFGVAVGEQLHRAFDVGEQHRHVLAFALERSLRRQDAVSKMLRRVGFGSAETGCGRRRCGGERLAAFTAELLARRIGRAARTASAGQACSALAAEFLGGGIIVATPRADHGSEPRTLRATGSRFRG
jgi:hypothetical protein